MDLAEKTIYFLDSLIYDSFFNELKCSICLELFEEPVSTKCNHVFCSVCIQSYLKDLGKTSFACPMCKTQMNKRDLKGDKKIQNIVAYFKEIKTKSYNMFGLNKKFSKRKNSDNESTENTSYNLQSITIESQKIEVKNESFNFIPKVNQLIRTFDEFNSKSFGISSISNHASLIKPSSSVRKQIKLLATAMPSEILDEIIKFCKLFRIKLYKDYKSDLSHLIVYPIKDKDITIQAKRTLKYIYSLIDGVWILSYRWIIDSILGLSLKNEEDYEVTQDSYAMGGAKTSRLKGGLKKLFENHLFHIIDEKKYKSNCFFKSDDLKEIIERTGGKLSLNLTQDVFAISITEEDNEDPNISISEGSEKNMISHKWILDSISNAKILDFNNYKV